MEAAECFAVERVIEEPRERAELVGIEMHGSGTRRSFLQLRKNAPQADIASAGRRASVVRESAI